MRQYENYLDECTDDVEMGISTSQHKNKPTISLGSLKDIKDKCVDDFMKYMKLKCICSVNIMDFDIVNPFAKFVLPKYVKQTKMFGYFNPKHFNGEIRFVNTFEPSSFDLALDEDNEVSYPIRYKNTIILISFRYMCNGVAKYEQTVLNFKCINTKENVEIMKEFIRKSTEYATKCARNQINKENMLESIQLNFRGDLIKTNVNKRSFSNVYVDDYIIESLDKHLTSFINNKDFYYKHGIPYHFGILLYGPPATGKSSLINVIASKYCDKMITISLADLATSPRSLINTIIYCVAPLLIVVEDIDCQKLSRNRNESEAVNNDKSYSIGGNVTMSDVLNVIDGSNALTNCIFVFTTNCIENIEPALIRPGRIDLQLEIKPPSKESLDKFFKAYYDKGHNLDEIKPNLSIADLQTKVLVGYTYEQLRDYCKADKVSKLNVEALHNVWVNALTDPITNDITSYNGIVDGSVKSDENPN